MLVFATQTLALAQEQYLREELINSINVGKVVELDVKNQSDKVLAFYTKHQFEQERGSVIILHDKLEHPDWKYVIRPLRTELPKLGWNTLSLQLPYKRQRLDDEEKLNAFYQSGFERIDSAILFLNKEKAKKVILVAYGSSAMYALRYLEDPQQVITKPAAAVSVIVLISPYSITAEKFKEQDFSPLEKIKMPLLDIFGSQDLDLVTKLADERQAIAKRSGNKQYLQQVINHADHFFLGQTETLVKRVHSFIYSATMGN